MKTIEENLDRIATAVERLADALSIASNILDKAEQKLSPTVDDATTTTAEKQEVDTATTAARAKRSRPGTGKGRVVEVNIPPTNTNAPACGLSAAAPQAETAVVEKKPEKVVEKQGVTFSPEGADTLLDSITQSNKEEAAAKTTIDDLIAVARKYMEASKSVNDKAVRKQKVIDILTSVGVNSIVKVEEKDVESVYIALTKLGA